MKTVFFIVFAIAGLEAYALYSGVDGVMFSAAVGGLSAVAGGIIGYLKGKKNAKITDR